MRNAVLTPVALGLVLTACGGGNGGTPPPTSVFTSLSISPTNPSLVIGDDIQMTATPRDQNGATMTGLGAPTFERVSGTAVTVSSSGRVVAEQQGSAQVRASLTSGGTTHTATTTATVAPLPTTASVTVSGAGTSFSPDSVRIATNGSVTWDFSAGANAPHNVTFATPAQVIGGDIPNTTSGPVERTFPTAGRFDYQCTRHSGMNGVVVVRAP